MEKDPKLMKFIEDKRKFEAEGYKTYLIFEALYIEEIRELYGKKMLSLEDRIENIQDNPPKKLGDFLMCGHIKKKFDESITGVKIIHVGSRDGFSKEEIVFIDDELTDESNKVKSQRFIDAIKKIVGNKEMTPDKSLLLISQDHHHQRCVSAKGLKENPKMKQREKTSRAHGQKSITDFFAVKKIENSALSTPYKKPVVIESSFQSKRPFEIEEITQKLRGDNVKILWMPKRHAELDATQYVSVFLLNEISRLIENNEDDKKAMCIAAIDRFPNKIWEKVSDYVEDCENYYLADDNDEASESDENEETPKVQVKEEKQDCDEDTQN